MWVRMSRDQNRSFDALAMPHLDLVYRVARRLCLDEHTADDLTQETFLRAYRSFATFEMREYGIRPWLLKILHNVYLNRLATESRGPVVSDAEQLEFVAAGAVSVGELNFEQLDGEVKQAIEQLSPEFRVVMLLWATMELSYQEIADIVGVPIGTVMSRLHRARQQLMRALSDYARVHHRVRTGQDMPRETSK